MKQILLFLVCFCVIFSTAYSQDPSWYTNVTNQVGLATTAQALRLNVVDLNGDKYPDIVSVENVNRRNMIHVYLNQQDSTSTDPMDRMFIEFTDSSGVNVHPDYPDSTRRSEIVSFADFDNDGDVDMVSGIWHWDPAAVNFPNDRSTVMLNDGTGRFTHVANNGLSGLGFISIAGFAFFDYNLDGKLDIFVGTFSDDHPNNAFRRDYIMVGNGDGTFYDRPSPFDLNTWKDPEYGVSVTDWNNDCFQDVFTSAYCRSGGALWKNINGGSFQNVALAANYSSQHMQGDTTQGIARDLCQWGAYPFDFDNDGDMDIFHSLVHGGLEATEGRSTIAVNSGAVNNYALNWELDRLVRANPQSFHLGNMDAAWVDIDNNMLTDLIVTETEYLPATDRGFWYIQDSTHYFYDKTPQLQLMNFKPHTLEAVDYDLDGDLDIIMNDRDDNTQIRVLRNEIGNQNNWLGLRLEAPAAANFNSIGARISVYCGGVRQIQEIQAGLGHWGGQAPFLRIFGLAQNTIVDSVTVRWPMAGCLTTTVYNPVINGVNTITENGLIANTPAPEEQLSVFPNPASQMVTISGQQLLGNNVELQLFDLMGSRIALPSLKRPGQGTFRFSVEGLAAGVYVVRALDLDSHKIWTQKLVVD